MITSVLPAVRDESRDDLITGWVLAARGGDSDAFDLFVRALHPDVRRHVRFLGADHQSAEDLIQEAFVLTKVLGSRYTEAVGISDRAVGTVRSRVARARGSLSEALDSAERRVPTAAAA